MKKLILALAIATIFMACKKEKDSENPVITITSPTLNQAFDADDISIVFSVTDADLHEVGFSVHKESNDSLLYNVPMDHTHDNPYNYSNTITINVSNHTDAVLKVKAEDHNGNMSVATRNFHIHPHAD